MINPTFITVFVRKSDFDQCHLQDYLRESFDLEEISSEVRSGFSTDGEIVAHYCMSSHAAKHFCHKFADSFGCKPDDKDHIAIYELISGGFLWDCDWLEEVDGPEEFECGVQLKSLSA